MHGDGRPGPSQVSGILGRVVVVVLAVTCGVTGACRLGSPVVWVADPQPARAIPTRNITIAVDRVTVFLSQGG
jgi:hypothetical protein